MNGLTKNKIAAILIALYTFPQTILFYSWIATGSPMIAEMAGSIALALFSIMLSGFMTVFGVWQDQKVYKIIALIICGVNALVALPAILFATDWTLRLSAIGGVVLFVAILVLLLRHTPQPVTA